MRRMTLAALATVALALVALARALRWMEPRMLYYPTRELEASPADAGWPFEDVTIRAADGVALHGWFIPAARDSERAGAERGTQPGLTVLFLHGNAGNISYRMEKLRILRELGAAVLIVDYRGYGRSEGRPDEPGLYRDARAAYDHLVRDRGIEPMDLVLHGES